MRELQMCVKTWCSLVLLFLILFFLAGCATTMKTTTTAPDGTVTEISQPGSMFGPSSYDEGYQGMYSLYSDSKTRRTAVIMDTQGPSDPVARAYADAAKLLAVALISTEKFDVPAPTTGFDVLKKAVDVVVPVAAFGAMWKLGEVAVKNAGSQVSGNAQVTNSMNHTEANPTVLGTNASSSPVASGTAKPSDVVVVEPSYPPVIQ